MTIWKKSHIMFLDNFLYLRSKDVCKETEIIAFITSNHFAKPFDCTIMSCKNVDGVNSLLGKSIRHCQNIINAIMQYIDEFLSCQLSCVWKQSKSGQILCHM